MSAVIIETRARITSRLRAACAQFGLEVRPVRQRVGSSAGSRPGPRLAATARRLNRVLRPGEIALVTGPSGAGKSTLLRELARVARASGRDGGVIAMTEVAAGCGVSSDARRSRRSVLDVVTAASGSVEVGLGVLSRAGLADARVLPLRPVDLSEGQRRRLAIALALARVPREGERAMLIVDEFASVLDRATAMGIAGTLERWARRARARVVCATAHDDVMEALGPSVLVVVGLDGRAEVHRRG